MKNFEEKGAQEWKNSSGARPKDNDQIFPEPQEVVGS
jgi:hypothetical protein